ncbi:hypothetical protein [Flavobacterium sp. ov086]|uniref:hypothetical protein n=1 Tax=Flavobacterium sp. ov086 TaxID=1761785 RepID=UPI000B626D8E|nr:hypothetical protein [Flavobacterium sp. ov086]SNR73620.1 hypothetical protein SAMN04487979_1193 [Flavobacterium sp. ov086]
MWIIEKIKNNIGTSIILTFILFCIVSSYFGDKKYKENRLMDYYSSFTGIIIKKYRQKGGVLIFYKDLTTFKSYQINPSDELIENCNVGDTITKLTQTNKCILKNKSKNLKVECYYVE